MGSPELCAASLLSPNPRSPSTAFQISRSQFVFSRDPLIGFIRCLDPINCFRQVTHNRKLEIAGAVAERCARVPYRVAKAKFVRHGSSNPKRTSGPSLPQSVFSTVIQKYDQNDAGIHAVRRLQRT